MFDRDNDENVFFFLVVILCNFNVFNKRKFIKLFMNVYG